MVKTGRTTSAWSNGATEALDSDENFAATPTIRYEGIAGEIDGSADMRVTRTFGYEFYAGRRNNMVLAHERVLSMQPELEAFRKQVLKTRNNKRKIAGPAVFSLWNRRSKSGWRTSLSIQTLAAPISTKMVRRKTTSVSMTPLLA